MKSCYEMVKEFKRKYPSTVTFRLKKHCKIIEKHLNPGEQILYAFAAQKNAHPLDFTNTNAVAITTKRIMIGTKRLLWGYFFVTITPDMFNDLTVRKNVLWGTVVIDTIKETITLSDIDPRALPEIETFISDYMMREKRRYREKNKEESKEELK